MGKLFAGLVKARALIVALVPMAALLVPHDKIAQVIDVTTQAANGLAAVAGTIGAIAAALMTAPKDHK